MEEDSLDRKSILLEEYRTVAAEKENQYKRRDFATFPGIGVVVAMLAFGFEKNVKDVAYYLFVLVVALFLYLHYVFVTILGLKADAYLRVFIESEIDDLNWYTEKVGYDVGFVRILHRLLCTTVFLSLILADLYLLWSKVDQTLAFVLGFPSLFLFLASAFQYHFHKDSTFISEWKRRRENISAKGKGPSLD